LPNSRKATLIVFLYSLFFTGCIRFLAVWLIPDDMRMKNYADNLIGGLAMNVCGPGRRLRLEAGLHSSPGSGPLVWPAKNSKIARNVQPNPSPPGGGAGEPNGLTWVNPRGAGPPGCQPASSRPQDRDTFKSQPVS
jgi:hypothetical protein